MGILVAVVVVVREANISPVVSETVAGVGQGVLRNRAQAERRILATALHPMLELRLVALVAAVVVELIL